MRIKHIIVVTIYFLVFINAASKIFLLRSIDPSLSFRKLVKVCLNATVVAFVILLLFTGTGTMLFKQVLHINLYSIKIAGGVVLFIVGLHAVGRGAFFEKDTSTTEGSDLNFSIVPLGSPLIASPAAITGAISLSSETCMIPVMFSLFLALGLNLSLMLTSGEIGRTLLYFHIIGATIRITGVLVAGIAVQMILSGLGDWGVSGARHWGF